MRQSVRQVLLVGGWGPELGVDNLWNRINCVSPSELIVLPDPPERETWRARLAGRGSLRIALLRADVSPAGNLPVWSGAIRISTSGSLADVAQRAFTALK